ncbi:Small subunit of laccase POXA3a [Mycena sanguinolenta]|uniref:Small subunit of laccase POXA3a n=1 Tax=Mycena sanguinolenta TaxID=230812 RepID=A0A8H6YH22_9AGAR|nr:Small subunit of laccase POXA3a [Mycena sanguinolenta]
MFFPLVFVLSLLSVACASKLDARQASNTNKQINSIVDGLDVTMHRAGPAILTLMAQHKVNDNTIGEQMLELGAAFAAADAALARVPASSGSTTVSPTNDDISITYSDVMQLLSSSLSGIIRTGAVPQFPRMIAVLDPIIAKTSLQLNVTSPGSLVLVTRMMLDASQFFVAEGFNQTLVALGF